MKKATFLAKSKKAIAGGFTTAVATYTSLAATGDMDIVKYCMVAGAFVGGFVVVWFTPKNAE